MLTVKVIRPDRSEYVEEATSVFLNNNQSVTYFKDGKAGYDVSEGIVYVMNSNGKTVADYFLSPIN